ncbi:MAG TPA: peptidoglycan DD-metalloendopeptidase family protein [Gammaproteobacteria bacterium]|nr:peptidoglycan DD-metalloendopeptidase family protein [Gammaproteobacteria bacterium]
MRKHILLVLFMLCLAGCAEQEPAQVVAAIPSTYRPSLALSTGESKVAKKLQLAAEKPNWIWPAQGSVNRRASSANPTQKGIDILGLEGAPVVAAADGEVVYSGSSLKGYGNLIIIKHKKNFLTAYAHNRKNMVKEGDKVVIGQRIAEMGRTGTDKVKLHFEVRQDGKPIDPQGVLPRR